MEVKNRWILGTILAMFLLIIVAFFSIQYFNLDTSNDTAYAYKEKLFIEDQVATIDIQIDEEDYKDMLENPLEEEYKKASITINSETISNVAVRTKGNSSLTMVANSDSDRYSLKVDFNYYDSSQSFYGLTKLNLNNNISDSSQMREFVSYEMMEKMGIDTPAHSYMNVTINGEPYGLLLGVEAIDSTYVKNYFKTAEGYLFKPDGTGSDLIYTTEDLDDYSGIDVEMNEENVEDSNLIPFIKAINSGDNIEDYLDVDEALRYFAMNTALVSLDSYQGQMKHNYYLYENSDGLYSILPWDYNMSFGGFGLDGSGGGGPMNNESRPQTEGPADNNTTQVPQMSNENPSQTEGTADNDTNRVPQMSNENRPQTEGSADNDMNQVPPMNNENSSQTEDSAGNDMNQVPPMNNENPSQTEGTANNAMNQEPTMNNAPQMQSGQGNDMGMMQSDLMNDSAINFSIYEPISGTSMEERPLLNVLLSNETYLAQYEAYLEEIATSIFTEENVQDITSNLANLLKDYVEADPSKFYTTEEFLEGVTGENSLAEFAKLRSESILKQLSGEYVAQSLASSGNSMNPPQNGGEMNNSPFEQNAQNGNPGANPDGNIPPQMNPAQNEGDMNNSQSEQNAQNGNPGANLDGNVPPQMNQPPNGQNGGMQANWDINSMTDEEFETFLETIQSRNMPFTLPDNFDQMTTEEKKDYINAQMEQMLPNGNPQQGGPMMNNENSDENETIGDFTKEDVYRLSIYVILMLIAIVIIRKIGR